MRSNFQTLVTAAGGLITGLLLIKALPVLGSVSLPGQTAWYGARASGIVAYLLATASVLFGMGISTRMGGRFLGRASIADAHRSLSLLSLFAIGAHTLFLALDQYAQFTAAELLIPFVTWYRTVWTGLGIIAAYLAVAVYVSFYLRSLIGYRTWRTFHYASFGVFVLGTLHGVFAGADAGTTWALALYGTSVALVAGMFAYRMATRSVTQPARTRRVPALATESNVA
jgi:predicted ferric reductase